MEGNKAFEVYFYFSRYSFKIFQRLGTICTIEFHILNKSCFIK